jgi:hypothetical protein
MDPESEIYRREKLLPPPSALAAVIDPRTITVDDFRQKCQEVFGIDEERAAIQWVENMSDEQFQRELAKRGLN